VPTPLLLLGTGLLGRATRVVNWAERIGLSEVELFVVFVVGEGEGEFVDHVSYWDAKDHFVAFAFTLEPSGAGDLLVGQHHGFA
jgi:hypothetical protein